MTALGRIIKGQNAPIDLQDLWMEATLLCLCLSLCKVAYLIHISPSNLECWEVWQYHEGGCVWYDGISLVRQGLAFASSLCNLNSRHTFLHVPAALVGSFSQSELLKLWVTLQGCCYTFLTQSVTWLSLLLDAIGTSFDVLMYLYSLTPPAQLMKPASPFFPWCSFQSSQLVVCHPACLKLVECSLSHSLHLLDCEFQVCLQYWLGL